MQALARRRVTSQIDVTVVGNHLERVQDRDAVTAAKTALLGLCLVVPQEYPHLRCSVIDLPFAENADCSAAGGPAGRRSREPHRPALRWPIAMVSAG